MFTIDFHPEEAPETDSDDGGDDANNHLPLASGSGALGESLAKAGSVQGLLLLHRHLFPVALLLLPQLDDLAGVLLEPDGGEGRHRAVVVGLLAVAAIADHLPLADLALDRLDLVLTPVGGRVAARASEGCEQGATGSRVELPFQLI